MALDSGKTIEIDSAKKKRLQAACKNLKEFIKDFDLDEALSLQDVSNIIAKSLVIESTGHSEFTIDQSIKDKYQLIGHSDGACRGNPGPGAWGIVIQDASEKVIFESSSIAASTTNNRMELAGVIEILKYVSLNALLKEDQSIIVYSDSKYVVDGMKSWVSGWKKRGWKKADKKAPENVELWQQLDELAGSVSVSFAWVKGHSGHPQNEHCDQLANKALDEAGY